MSDLGKIPGFNNTPDVKVETQKISETKNAEEKSAAKGSSLAEVRAKHFIPGQSQIAKDDLTTDMKILAEHPELVDLSNDLGDKVYEDYIALGYSPEDAAGMAANVQSAFVEEMIAK